MRKFILPVFALALIAISGTAMANTVNRDDVRHYKNTATTYHGGVEKYVPNTHKRAAPSKHVQHKNKKYLHKKHGPKHHGPKHHGRHHANGARPGEHHVAGWQNRGGEGWNHRLDYSHANDDRGQ